MLRTPRDGLRFGAAFFGATFFVVAFFAAFFVVAFFAAFFVPFFVPFFAVLRFVFPFFVPVDGARFLPPRVDRFVVAVLDVERDDDFARRFARFFARAIAMRVRGTSKRAERGMPRPARLWR